MRSGKDENAIAAEQADDSGRPAEKAVLIVQGAYYLATGIWPLISMRTFESVTGPKVDKWLVNTVGVLVGVIGAVLIAGANRRAANPEAQLLAAGSAAGLAAIDVTYVMKRRIAPVYLLDALGEVALLIMLGWARHKRRKNSDAGTGKHV
jgi:hypothetical protein